MAVQYRNGSSSICSSDEFNTSATTSVQSNILLTIQDDSVYHLQHLLVIQQQLTLQILEVTI